MEKQLKKILTDNMNIFNAVGERISPIKRDDFPSITYEKLSREQNVSISGQPIGPAAVQFAISIRAKTYREASQIGEGVYSALTGFTGEVDNINFLYTEFNDQSESQQYEPDHTEITFTYTFHHTTAPAAP